MSAQKVRAVFLAGFMGSGKNTVGQELARRLGWNFVDLDACIETREQQSIPEIFRLRGEPAFRAAETIVLRDLLTGLLDRPTVVALGGGAFVQQNNRELLRPWPTVFLDAPVQELWDRCRQHEARQGVARPLQRDPEQFARLHAERLPSYRQASVVIETSGKETDGICSEIERALQLSASVGDQSSNLPPDQSGEVSPANRIIGKTLFDDQP
ncbi:MAG: shikimate kinase [Terriglobales bacterium]|jgi:shikimate kinase